ncbi:response regulator transcription factor [Streptomyces sp. NPDC005907]|uniref:response regulator transcription factor n=1 Tax=Streptomyces sp. NPDC005907 TaxID=3154571 RepID=UPI0033F12EBD
MEQQPYESPGPGRGARVLVVDDDPTVAEIVSGYLDRAGYAVDRAGDGPEALARAAAHRPDLVVLDLMLPGMDGLEVCRRLRARGPVPVVMLTARGDEDDRILGLEVGADDYVTKPFSPRELVLRVESVLRRTGPAAGVRPLRSGGLTVDPGARRATKGDSELALTVREFDLLAFFLRNPGRAFGREELMREVWGWDFGDLSTVTVHVRRLRGKVEDDPARPRLIHTVWGVGYRFEGPAVPVEPRDTGEPAPARGEPAPGIGEPAPARGEPAPATGGPAPGTGGPAPGTGGPDPAAPAPGEPVPPAPVPDVRRPDASVPDVRPPNARTPGGPVPAAPPQEP